MKKPEPEDYGYFESNSFDEESGWMLEGGEAKYYDEFEKWESYIADLADEFKMVKYRIEQEGFHYCFKHYSTFPEIKDQEFHRLRESYLKAARELEMHVSTKILEYEL